MIALLLSLPALAVDVARDGTINTTTMSGLGPNFRLWLDPTLSNPGEVLGRAVDRNGRLVPGEFLVCIDNSCNIGQITLTADTHVGIHHDPVATPPGGAPTPVAYGEMVRPSDVAAEDRFTVTVQDIEQTGDRLKWCGKANQQDEAGAREALVKAKKALEDALDHRYAVPPGSDPTQVAQAEEAIRHARTQVDDASAALARASTLSFGFATNGGVTCDPILHVRQEFRTAGELLEVPGLVNVIPGLRVALGVSRKRERWVTIHSWLRERRYPSSPPSCTDSEPPPAPPDPTDPAKAYCKFWTMVPDATDAAKEIMEEPKSPKKVKLSTKEVVNRFNAGRATALEEVAQFARGVAAANAKDDGDKLVGDDDNCPHLKTEAVADEDDDGIGDTCEPDGPMPRPLRNVTTGDLRVVQDIVVAGRAAQPDGFEALDESVSTFEELRAAACANPTTSGVVGAVYVGHLFVSSASSTAVRTWLKGKAGRASVGPTLAADEASGVSNATYSRVVGYSIDWCSPEAQAEALGYESMRQRVQAYLYRPNGKKRSQLHWNRIANTKQPPTDTSNGASGGSGGTQSGTQDPGDGGSGGDSEAAGSAPPPPPTPNPATGSN